jgi:5,10-methylenetetrahydromethanopterin reductase
MQISSQFQTSLHSPEHVAISERLGYDRAWLQDAPAHSPDVWMMLALAAQRTTRIGLGPGVLVPTMRHPMVTTAHRAGHAPARPIAIPVLIAALGPRGLAVAKELGDGLFTVNGETEFAKHCSWTALGVHGTVLGDGERLDSPRVRAAAGPGIALAYHATYEFGGDVTQLPAGQVWLDLVDQTPEQERHLAVHDQHLAGLNQADEGAWAAGSWAAIPTTTLTGSAAQLTERLAVIAEQGITEIVYQPTGPDIPRELEAFITAARAVLVG